VKLLVTGREGQVVRSLLERAGAGVQVEALGRPALDLAEAAGIAGAIAASFGGSGPDVVIHAAAYTAVDRAEGEEALALAINGAGAGAVAAAAQELGAQLIHISTDYVYDGAKPAPYVESDACAPQGAYGRSKLAGEAAILAAHPGAVIARTAWVYSPFGANFVKTMLRLASTRAEVGAEVSVVADQLGCPTNALDMADALLVMAARLRADPSAALRGVFHVAGSGEGSWADLAEAVFAASAAHGGPAAAVKRITTADYPTPARRPANSRLCGAKLAAAYGLALPDWRASVAGVVARLLAEQEKAA